VAATRRGTIPPWVITTTWGLALLAVGLTTYLTVTHYTDPSALACPDTGIVNCTAVTTSSWSAIAGVPVALIGLLWAVVMATLTSPWAWRSSAAWVDTARLAFSGAGAVMVLYLVYVELFRVDAICLWCTGVHLTTIALFGVVLASRGITTARRQSSAPRVCDPLPAGDVAGGDFAAGDFAAGDPPG
jgi:uncharacterized membrane protein